MCSSDLKLSQVSIWIAKSCQWSYLLYNKNEEWRGTNDNLWSTHVKERRKVHTGTVTYCSKAVRLVTSQLLWAICSTPLLLSYALCSSLVMVYAHCFPSSHCAPLWRAWLHLPRDLLVRIGKLLLGPSDAFCSPGWKKPSPLSLSPLRRTMFQPPNTELASVYRCPLYIGGPKSDTAF